MSSIAIYHEHPDWFKPLFAELDKRGLQYTRLNPAAHQFWWPQETLGNGMFVSVWQRRMSPD